jgi:hypothetical protein
VARRATAHEAEALFQTKTQPYQSILRLPDLEHAKAGVLNRLNSTGAKRGYRQAIDEFVDWYCSELRLAFTRIVVFGYRSHPESRQIAPVRSICDQAPCAAWHTKHPTAVVSARTGLPELVESKVRRSWDSPWQLVNGRARQCALASTRSSATERKT